MVDYSKWDNIELSDDSDIEVHPNVDKGSFIRAKQNQIHAERQQRKIQIEGLKYERLVNDTLLQRLSSLLSTLKATNDQNTNDDDPADPLFRAAVEIAVLEIAVQDPAKDQPPPRPPNVFPEYEPLPTFSQMILSLLDDVKTKVASSDIQPEKRFDAIIDELEAHVGKLQTAQADLATKLSGIEKEDGVKITSESYHVGFDSSHVSKGNNVNAASTGTEAELLNPGFADDKLNVGRSDWKATEQPQPTGDEEVRPSLQAREFAQIQPSDYPSSWRYILAHPEILRESDTDGWLTDALNVAIDENNDEKTWRYVHQALLLQFCRALGHDGVNLFFTRITAQDHRAKEIFITEVKDKFEHIRELAREHRSAESQEDHQVEHIQIQAVDPDTSIQIRIPNTNSDEEEEKHARAVYEELPPKVQEALQSGSLERVNEVLGEMDVAEAEILVSQLEEARCIDIEEDVSDATTDDSGEYLEDSEASVHEKKNTSVEDDTPSH